jgi:putative membrane protein insertion efficiency factor
MCADNRQPTTDSSPFKKVVLFMFTFPIKIYQATISPFFPAACRYNPSCSHYAVEAIKKYGPVKGWWLAMKRIARCHPWGGSGYDPVP